MPQLRLIATIICFLISLVSFSQKDSTYKKINREISDQRKKNLEENWNQRILNGIYVSQGIEKYKGKIEITGDNTILFDSTTLRLDTYRPEYKIIFEKGIFYPGIFSGNFKGEIEAHPIRPDSLSALGNCFTDYNIIRVNIFEEIIPDKNTHTTKRFRMWRWSCAIFNPSEYIFDIENKTANEKTTLKDFIEGSKVTFIKFVTIII